MENTPKILFIDDDRNVRSAFVRSLRGQDFEVDVAEGLEAALALAANNVYAVIATDYRMPETSGIDVVEELSKTQPLATYVLVSGECDRDLVLEAVNNHPVANVIAKPWDVNELRDVLRRGITAHWERSKQLEVQKNVVQASRALEEMRSRAAYIVAQAEGQVVGLLTTMLEQRYPEVHAHARRVAAYAKRLAQEMGLSERQVANVEAGALLHDIGRLVDAKDGASAGSQLLERFESLGEVRSIIEQQHERWDGSGAPRKSVGGAISRAARIVAVADELDARLSGQDGRAPVSFGQARQEIIAASGSTLDPEVVQAFRGTHERVWVELGEGALSIAV